MAVQHHRTLIRTHAQSVQSASSKHSPSTARTSDGRIVSSAHINTYLHNSQYLRFKKFWPSFLHPVLSKYRTSKFLSPGTYILRIIPRRMNNQVCVLTGVTTKAGSFSPSPLRYVPLLLSREDSSYLSPLVDSHRIVPTHPARRSQQWIPFITYFISANKLKSPTYVGFEPQNHRCE